MKVIRFVFFLIITLALITFLNSPYNGIPPLGKLLSPHQGFWQNAEKDAISTPSTLKFDGLKEEVTVRFDEQLFPHIFAQNDEDLFFAQGYVTAFHRLWQMEFQQLNTAGRLAEVLGEGLLERDRGQRRKGLTYGAQRTLEKAMADPEAAKILEAYTRGVNAYIDELDYADFPIEYKLLDYAPEPWTELKCALLLSMMSDDLSRGEADLQNTNALKLWGRDTFDILYPERHPDIDPVIPAGTPFDFAPIPVEQPDVQLPNLLATVRLEEPDPKNGSNNFVVSGSKTADGAVLFANEPDLGLNLPSIWYVCHLNSPNYNVMGASLPGSPLVIIGMNDSIAWGMTNAKRDLVDWYYIEFRDATREEYKYDDKWLKTQKVVEEFAVKGGSTVYDTIIYTHYGPVAYDRNYDVSPEELNLAMRWTAHDASDYQTFMKLNQAYNYEAYSDALSRYVGPPQNIAFGSAAGDIAIRISGKFPVKWQEQGKFIMDGRDSRQEWQPMMPWDHTYKALNPPQGFLSSANQHPGDGTYPYYDYDHNFEYYRNRRINDRLNVMTNITEEDMMALQNDNFNYIASEILPLMLDSLQFDSAQLNTPKGRMYTTLSAWDFFNEPDLSAPSIFELWQDSLYNLVWDEFKDHDEMSLMRPSRYNTHYILMNRPDFGFVDRLHTPIRETTGDLFRKAFDQAHDGLEQWKEKNGDDYAWYKFKNTSIFHILQIRPFSREQVRIGGNHNIVNAASGRHGPSWRFVAKLDSTGTRGWGVYPGSQTGNPGNPAYGHMIDPWSSGEYYELLFDEEIPEDHESIVHNLRLIP